MEERERWVCGGFKGRGMGFAREEERGERLVAAMRDGNTSSKKSRERERERERLWSLCFISRFLTLWFVLGLFGV